MPRPFTAERPAVSFSYQTQVMNIEDHPLAKDIPKATEAPSIQPGPQVFRAFAAAENASETLEDFIYTDTPQLSLFIVSFNNATLVTLSWPHTAMDVMGQQALLRAWCLVLDGKASEVPPLIGARDDTIRKVANAPTDSQEEYGIANQRLQGVAMVMFGFRFAMDLLWNRVVETRTICLPKKAMDKLYRQAEDDLHHQDPLTGRPFISEGDVLTAWAIRAVATSLPQPRPVTALHALNARCRISSLMQASGVYVQNMAVAAFSSVSAEAARGPLGPLALENRRHIKEQSTESQVLAYLRELQKGKTLRCDPATMLYCEPSALLMPFTNWTRADFFNVIDFGPAVVRAGASADARTNQPGTIVFHHAQSMRPNPTARNVIVVLGKDHVENYWITGTLLPQTWQKMKDELDVM